MESDDVIQSAPTACKILRGSDALPEIEYWEYNSGHTAEVSDNEWNQNAL